MLFTVTVVLCLLLSLSAHELGHALTMREANITVKKVGLIGFPGLGSLELPIKHSLFPGTRWYIHPLILGAYVEPDHDEMDRASRDDKFVILGAGALGNFCYALVILGFSLPMISLDTLYRTGATPSVAHIMVMLCSPLIGIAFAAKLWRIRRKLRHIFLPLGCLLLVACVWIVVSHVDKLRWSGMSDAVAGIHSTSNTLTHLTYLGTLGVGFTTGAVISVIVGIGNLLPLMPMDGGKIAYELLPKRLQNTYLGISVSIFLILTILPIAKDIWNAIQFVWRFLT